jgi:hypothetical protein
MKIDIQRAEHIVDRIEALLTDNELSLLKFTPLSLTGAATRREAVTAMQLVVASTLQDLYRMGDPTLEQKRGFGAFVKAAGHAQSVVWYRVFPDEILEELARKDGVRRQSTLSTLAFDALSGDSRKRLEALMLDGDDGRSTETMESFVPFLLGVHFDGRDFWTEVSRRLEIEA